MKKSEALKILGLSEGASDEDVKKAHRKLVIENHPDKFGQDPQRRAEAEEKTKLINEARDASTKHATFLSTVLGSPNTPRRERPTAPRSPTPPIRDRPRIPQETRLLSGPSRNRSYGPPGTKTGVAQPTRQPAPTPSPRERSIPSTPSAPRGRVTRFRGPIEEAPTPVSTRFRISSALSSPESQPSRKRSSMPKKI